MKKTVALFSVALILLFSNYQVYAQVSGYQSICFGCCPSECTVFSSCTCDVNSDDVGGHKQSVSATTVSKIFVRFCYSSAVVHFQPLNFIKSGAVEIQKIKTGNRIASLTKSSFQIPLRI